MSKLVTIGIPVYRRFEYLPSVLDIVASQDYPNIELLVSDNGMNGTAVPEFVAKHYRKPFRFRQNPSTVGISMHFSQLIREASGEYFVPLADDDEISPNYVSDLVSLLEKHPEASIAMSIQESIDEAGHLLSRSEERVPQTLSGPDFIRAIWGTHEFGYRSLSTYLARTKRLIDCGCYPIFCVAQFDEDALIVKACLDNFITFSAKSTFRKRYHDSSDQSCLPIHDLAKVVREFLTHVNTDRQLAEFAAAHPAKWAESKRILVEDAWKTYYYRWTYTYKGRMPQMKWAAAGFALPFIPSYYRAVLSALVSASLEPAQRKFPQAFDAYRTLKTRLRKPA